MSVGLVLGAAECISRLPQSHDDESHSNGRWPAMPVDCSGAGYLGRRHWQSKQVQSAAMILKAARVFAMAIGTGVVLFACMGSADEPTPRSANSTTPNATAVAATVIAGGPTAIAEGTEQARAASIGATGTDRSGSEADGSSSSSPNGSSAAQEPGTMPSSNATPEAQLRVVLAESSGVVVNGTVASTVRLEGDIRDVAAFNFDIVYDQRLVTLDAPGPNLDALNVGIRRWQCDLPPANGDVDPDPTIGRARLVCFSFGGPDGPAPETPLTIATVTVRGVSRGLTALRLENIAVFGPDAHAITVDASPATVQVE